MRYFIPEQLVLTAAHCLYLAELQRFAFAAEVLVRKQADGTFSRRLHIERYTYHLAYDPVHNEGYGPFDIALIKLKDCLDMDKPQNAQLDLCPGYYDYPTGLAIGMGWTSETQQKNEKGIVL